MDPDPAANIMDINDDNMYTLIFWPRPVLVFGSNVCTPQHYISYDAGRFIYYRKSVLHQCKSLFHVRLSRCSTELR